ncbi:undecaprenyl-phosphate glucose phosphotransferase [Thiomicrorhabdus sp.]|uniref:undecaprenyl-phosphate glucose phosphotransferase n=1 Tax=Thiomicrorhabdus sp. TaxID=2039724 RepID=UPI0029C7D8E5|nr:undecaprenyl-phosphate glucose phosphotransferase [Thiomicrorhabdus sp.]
MQSTKINTDRSNIVWLHRFSDVIIPLISLFIITTFFSENWHDRYLIMGILGGLLFIFSAQFVGIYINWRGRSLFDSFKLILSAWLLTWVSLIAIAFLVKDAQNFSRIIITEWALVTPAILMGYRLILRLFLGNIRTSGKHHLKVAILGAGKTGLQIAKTFEKNPWLGYKVTAFYDDNTALHGKKLDKIKVIGDCLSVVSAAKKHQFNEIIICLPLKAEDQIKNILKELTDTTVTVKFVPDLFSFDLMHSSWINLNGIPIIGVFDTPLNSRFSTILKRTEDIIVSSLILILISPVLLGLAIAIKLTSPGPIIFKQKRYGLNGKEISVYKFRSMTCQDNGPIVKQATKNDSRITPLGSFIRRTSLDELPQFVNVLQGKMSIVGPRPHAVAHNEEYRKLVHKYMQRHLVKPGITGWAQINGWRGETDTIEKMEKRVEFDLYYINNWSLWMDFKIIFLTIFKGFINKNAY